MNERKKQIGLRIFLTTVTLLFVAWIYSNSLKNGAESTAQSGKVLTLLRNVFAFLFPKSDFLISMHFVRKAAHFCEYALLGFLLFFTWKSYRLKTWLAALFSFLAGTLVAFSDEGLQFFSEGRAPALADVGIDSSGALCGASVALAALAIVGTVWRKKKLRKNV